ncbi:hypothetical protein [Streptomyces sp. NPDC091268]|uniref:hypothetical protein n=1 Tax=Streptomyces sp. NPDC091268 TaxID=3365979 RepID=UPI00381BEF96
MQAVWYSGPPEAMELLKTAALRCGVVLRAHARPTANEAEELVSALADLFLEVGYEGDYVPTPEGLMIESLIDGLSEYCGSPHATPKSVGLVVSGPG